MSISIRWNEEATGRQTPQSRAVVSSDRKMMHLYKGYVAHRDREYETMWGPILDGNGNTVDGLPGLYNDLSMLERSIDGYIKDRAIQDRLKQQAIDKNKAPDAEEPGEMVETPTQEAPPPPKPYIPSEHDSRVEMLRSINNE